LITYGIVLARIHNDQALFIFQRAIEVAHGAGAVSTAGLAALTMIEELDHISLESLSYAYEQAGEWLSTCQSQDLWQRFAAAGKKLARGIRDSHDASVLINKPCDLVNEVLQFERRLISQALATSSGSITRAAKWLGVGHQRLAYTIQTRHPDLLNERSPVRLRSRKSQ
jgi:DNA-binding NtrC family response regulator